MQRPKFRSAQAWGPGRGGQEESVWDEGGDELQDKWLEYCPGTLAGPVTKWGSQGKTRLHMVTPSSQLSRSPQIPYH